MTREREGVLLSLLAAVAYSTTGVFAKLSYDAGVGVLSLLVIRTVLAAILFWFLVAVTRSSPSRPLPRSVLAKGFLLGLLGTSVQIWMYAEALARIDAGLASLLLYTYPAMVAVAAVLLGRERPSARRFVALAAATVGIAFVLLGAGGASLDGLGVALALGAAVMYTTYLLVGHALLAQLPPVTLAAVGSSGAAVAFLAAGLVTGDLDFGFETWGWGPALGTALGASVLAVGASLAAVARVGPTVNSILLTIEIPLGVLFAVAFLGERLRPPQIVGAALVVAAVLLVQLRRSPDASATPAASALTPERPRRT